VYGEVLHRCERFDGYTSNALDDLQRYTRPTETTMEYQIADRFFAHKGRIVKNLRRVMAGLLVTLLACGGSLGRILASSVSGRVLDERTGDGVPNATIFYWYEYVRRGSQAVPLCGRWTTTDATGTFHFAPRPCICPPLGLTCSGPHLLVVDRVYGTFYDMGGDEITFRIKPDLGKVAWLQHQASPKQRRYTLCGKLDEKACDHACELFYSSVDACRVKPFRLEPQPVPEIRGTVIDKRDGSPVVGIEVYASWWASGYATGYPFETRWATTNDHGEFSIPAHNTLSIEADSITLCPGYHIVHPDYGWRAEYPKEAKSPPGCFTPTIEIEPNPKEIDEVRDPRQWLHVCRSLAPEGCEHACKAVHGSKRACDYGWRPPG